MEFLAEFYNNNFNLIAGVVAGIVAYFSYVAYSKLTEPVYESVNDNILLLTQLRAARLKQEQDYKRYIEENGDELKKKTEQQMKELNQHLSDVRKMRLGEIPTSNTPRSSATREYFPLMGDPGTDTGYKPTKKKPPGGCSGGGCG